MNKKNLYIIIGVVFIAGIVLININLAKQKSVLSSLIVNQFSLLAFGETFTFNGETWNNTDVHGIPGDWKPYMQPCKTKYAGAQNNGHLVSCSYGNGNCNGTTECIKDTN
jgi:hypothetical protein